MGVLLGLTAPASTVWSRTASAPGGRSVSRARKAPGREEQRGRRPGGAGPGYGRWLQGLAKFPQKVFHFERVGRLDQMSVETSLFAAPPVLLEPVRRKRNEQNG